MATTTEKSSDSDQTFSVQTQSRTGEQSSVSTPGARTQLDTPAAQRTRTSVPASLQFSIKIERINPTVQ